MTRSRMIVVALALALAAASMLSPRSIEAAPAAWALHPTVERSTSGLVLRIHGTAPARAWLGCSFYPLGARSALAGIDRVRLVSGSFDETFAVPSSCLGGGYSAALWSTRVMAAQCTIPHDPWCRKNGFHLAGLLSIHNGTLK